MFQALTKVVYKYESNDFCGQIITRQNNSNVRKIVGETQIESDFKYTALKASLTMDER